MSLLGEVEWEPCLLPPRPDPALAERLEQRYRRVPGSLVYFSACPELFEASTALSMCFTDPVHLEHDLCDMVGSVVSQDHSCRYCYAVQRAILRGVGFSEERIRRIADEALSDEHPPKVRAALEFARRVSRSNPLPTAADAKQLEEHGYSDMEIKELAALIAVHTCFNRISTLPALPPSGYESLPDRWYVKLLRPFYTLYIHRTVRRRAEPRMLRDDEKQGPFSEVICALDGLPVAGDLRRMLDLLCNSGALPKRTKALIFAVIGRALGCQTSEVECSRIAVEAGVDQSTVDDVLDHLSSPSLSEDERLLLPLARETVWYEPAPLQRRAREACDRLTTEQFIEFVLCAATANMMCRLGVIVASR